MKAETTGQLALYDLSLFAPSHLAIITLTFTKKIQILTVYRGTMQQFVPCTDVLAGFTLQKNNLLSFFSSTPFLLSVCHMTLT